MSVTFSLQFENAFSQTPVTFNAFLKVLNSSKLLQSILLTYNCKVVLGAKGGGTYTSGYLNNAVITIDPAAITQFGTQSGLAQLADALAHEFGHALLTPTADQLISSAANPDAAKVIGSQQEGSAVLAEYVAAKQLNLPIVYSDNVPDSKITTTINGDASTDGVASQLAATVIADLTAPAGSMIDFARDARNDGGTQYSTHHPSSSQQNDYNHLWAGEWITGYLGYSGLVNWNTATTNTIKETGDSLSGWSWSGTNVTLLAGSAADLLSGTTSIVAGETLSFSGTENVAGTVLPGPMTLAIATSDTITGGAGNDNFYSRPGTNNIVVNFSINGFVNYSGALERVVADPQGIGSLTLKTLHPNPMTIVFGSAPITATGFKQWTDGTDIFQFIPGDLPGDFRTS